MTLKRKCQNCCHFQDAGIARSGWCHHPTRKTSAGELILVRGDEIACRDEWTNDLWESVLAPLDKTLVRLVKNVPLDGGAGDSPLSSALLTSRSKLEFERQMPKALKEVTNVAPVKNAEQSRQLRVFLCHASGDKPAVRNLYKRLVDNGIEPWLDEINLLPGHDWQVEVSKAVRHSDVVIVCLSPASVRKTGFVQKEIGYALDVAEEQPEGSIFLVPLRLEDCVVPERLRRFQWANLHSYDGFDRLMRSLEARSVALGLTIPS
jgi:hypothetical protein